LYGLKSVDTRASFVQVDSPSNQSYYRYEPHAVTPYLATMPARWEDRQPWAHRRRAHRGGLPTARYVYSIVR